MDHSLADVQVKIGSGHVFAPVPEQDGVGEEDVASPGVHVDESEVVQVAVQRTDLRV
jgi:hypothetical protein